MKKLKLKLDGIKEMLTKEQMKKISGGYDYGGCFNCFIVYSVACGSGDDMFTCCDPQGCVASFENDPCIVSAYCDR
ncbi:MAG: hypothetical protein JWQ79_1856 [Mucilaginibacter sp.]|nr:hypothetical protein [Mucilaginibacter sp.]